MKKITFFLCALLISAMSFAGEATLSFANKAQRTSYSTSTQVWVQNGITVTNNKSKSTSNVGDYANPARFYKSSELIVECSEGNITKIVFDCNSPSYAIAMQTSIGAAATASSDKVTVILDGSSTSFAVSSLGGQVRMDAITVTYAAGEGEVNAPSIPISQNFLSSLEITMTLVGEGDIYYTLDGTDPTTTSTKYTAPFTITETTTVKAIAENGGKASSIATATYTKVEPLTTMDAIFAKATAADQQVFVTFNNWIVTGVKNSNAYVTDGTKGLIIYQSGHGLVVGDVLSGTIECTLVLYKGSAELKGVTSKTSGLIVTEGGEAPVNELNEESIAALGGVHTGSVIKISGEVTTSSSKYYINGVQLYNSLFEFGTLEEGEQYDCIGVYCQFDTTKEVMPRSAEDLVKIETGEPLIKAEDELTFDAIALGAEVEAQTLTVTGANLTAEITATLDNEKFTVTPATLPAAGGDLTIAPAADLAVGEHTATLTLTSGETTKEVALSVLVKDVYTITWSVNGETSTTSVVEGDKLVLPAAPEAPEACSEKVFVGWTAAEEVNADGSDIEWVTAATAPTAAATYYAVFAAQEGEGGAAEEGTVTLAYTGTTTSNMDVEANNATIVGLDETKWNVIAAKGDNSNAPGLNKAGDIRLYYGDPTSNTITVTSLDETVTISTIVITYTGDDYSNGKILVNDAAVTGTDGTYEINANSFTITNGNTSNVQVRFKNIVINYFTGAPATYTDYSTTCEAEPEYDMEITCTNLKTVSEGNMTHFLGTSADGMEIDLIVFGFNGAGTYEGVEGSINAGGTYIQFTGTAEYAASTIEGTETNVLTAELALANGMTVKLTMYNLNAGDTDEPGTPGETITVEMYDATFTVEDGIFYIEAEDDNHNIFLYIEPWNGYGDYEAYTVMGFVDDVEVANLNEGASVEKEGLVATLYVVLTDGTNTYNVIVSGMAPAEAGGDDEPVEPNDTITITANNLTADVPYAGYLLLKANANDADDTQIILWLVEGDTKGYGEYGYTEYPSGLWPDVENASYGDVYLTLSEDVVAKYYQEGGVDVFEGTFLGDDNNLYILVLRSEAPTVGLENLDTTVAPAKAIVNGQLVIIKNGVQYNAQGAVVK